ncbi:hypothetical protein AB0O90_16965 [Microbacterium testaceum]|uniref:hypothetical protein n=1 Tax=Microbacterium testaceum TaxID=2033 RepID=UPI003434C512
MRRVIRGVLAAALAGLVTVTLSGCFMIPLIDGRSPFDDPFGSSKNDIEKAIPPIQAAIDESGVADGGVWRIVAERGSDNCEGPCKLRVDVSVEPADVADLDTTDRPDLNSWYPNYAVSEEMLRAVLVAVIPVAERNRVDVSIVPGYGELSPGGSTISADLSGAVEALFASRPRGDGYSTRFGEGEDGEVEAFTRTKSGVLQEMGLG